MYDLISLTMADLIKSLGFTFLLSIVMVTAYKLCHDSLTYNRKFNIALVMMAFVSTILLLLVQKNPLMSLGVLGSLSICRIRMNTKDPRDLGFVFWALSIGISSAMEGYLLGIMGAIVLFAVLFISSKVNNGANGTLVVVRGQRCKIETAQNAFPKKRSVIMQSENIFENDFELVYELHVKKNEQDRIVSILNNIDGITGVNILAPETQAG